MQQQINGYSQDIGQLQADVSVINTELARQTHFRGYFATNDEILALTDVSRGDYAYCAEDLLVWIYDTSWYETDQIVPDQMTPASDANPQADGTVTAGTSTEYSRGDHQLPLNISTTVPISDTASGSVGTSVNYARNDHSHPLNIITTLPLQDSTGSVGTANYYARSYHQHLINVETNATNIPIVDGVLANGSSAYYARQDHVHLQQLTYDGNVTATKSIKAEGTSNDILLADGTTEKSINPTLGQGYDEGLRIERTVESTGGSSIFIGCSRSSIIGDIAGFEITQANDSGDTTRGLQISANGNSLNFNGNQFVDLPTDQTITAAHLMEELDQVDILPINGVIYNLDVILIQIADTLIMMKQL
ncbi:MAG: hypothetical protein EZS28_012816 [Streblomastix strix]|uniref:Uncharacterized protein n=1 Tax=Streblomastix strix TaxID=222440 RepID=A0A5J4W9Q4_9EUKA|nr:MAG: hypothetical protein EZS28_012816 [Streblomastix strix]